MRRPAVALLSAVLLLPSPALAASGPSADPVGSGDRTVTNDVTFRGYRVEVPANWRVVDLAARPHACVRFDRPAIYLGHPGDQAACPAHLVGGAPGLLVEPLDDSVAARATAAGVRTLSNSTQTSAPLPSGGSVGLAVEEAGVLVTAVYGVNSVGVVRRVVGNATVTSAAERTQVSSLEAPQSEAAAAGAARATTVETIGSYTGKGFDTCTAPSQATMNAWRASSPYRSVGIYVGGMSRACAQPNLTRDWVSAQSSKGWHLVPTYVGLQAPCTGFRNRMSYDASTARTQGRREAADAVARAADLGIAAPSAIYSDMEGYDNTNTACRTAVLSYLSGWTARLHDRGYTSGVYSSASSGIRDLASVYDSSEYNRPDHIWIAWWNGEANVDGGSYVPDAYWSRRQRIHQYVGNVGESWGGAYLLIDRNYLDVTVAAKRAEARGCPTRLTFPSYPVLRLGATGPEVRAAECRLIRRGFESVRAGGVYGAKSQSSVMQLQADLGFRANGIAGRHVWTALLSTGDTPRLAIRAEGRAVRRLQRSLDAALPRSVGVDGTFDVRTRRAVRVYQTSRGLAVNGIVGADTWAALQNGR